MGQHPLHPPLPQRTMSPPLARRQLPPMAAYLVVSWVAMNPRPPQALAYPPNRQGHHRHQTLDRTVPTQHRAIVVSSIPRRPAQVRAIRQAGACSSSGVRRLKSSLCPQVSASLKISSLDCQILQFALCSLQTFGFWQVFASLCRRLLARTSFGPGGDGLCYLPVPILFPLPSGTRGDMTWCLSPRLSPLLLLLHCRPAPCGMPIRGDKDKVEICLEAGTRRPQLCPSRKTVSRLQK